MLTSSIAALTMGYLIVLIFLIAIICDLQDPFIMATPVFHPLRPLMLVASSSSQTSSASTASSTDNDQNDLTSPAISRIVKVTIACALIVLAVTGIILASKVRPTHHRRPFSAILLTSVSPILLPWQITRFIRSRREAKRRRLIVASLDASMGMTLGATGQRNWMAQNSKKNWGGRKTKNAHKQVEWEGVAA